MAIIIDLASSINFKKKYLTYIFQILIWLVNVYVVLKAVLSVSNGYLPIYTFLFFLCGYLIHCYFCKRAFLKTIEIIKTMYKNNRIKILTIIFPIELTRKILFIIKKLLKKIFKKKKIANDNIDENKEKNSE